MSSFLTAHQHKKSYLVPFKVMFICRESRCRIGSIEVSGEFLRSQQVSAFYAHHKKTTFTM